MKKNPDAVSLANMRTKKLSKKRRTDIAKHAATTRWAKIRSESDSTLSTGKLLRPLRNTKKGVD